MGNEWIDFVRQFAKDNNMTYSHAIKEAAPAYRRMKNRGSSAFGGKGLDDLPDTLQGKIGSYLDDKSLGRLATTNLGMRSGDEIMNDLEVRRQKREAQQFPRVMREIGMSIVQYLNTTGSNRRPEVFERMQSYMNILTPMQDNPYLSVQQQRLLQGKITFFSNQLRNRR